MAENREDLEPMWPEFSYLKVVEWKGLAEMREFLRKPHSGFFSLLDAEKVVSLEQVRICYSKSQKIVETSSRIRMPESAFLMLLSGQNQIARAQEEVGISSSTKFVLAVYDNRDDYLKMSNSCGASLEETGEMPLPESDRLKDGEIFSRMARVQLAL